MATIFDEALPRRINYRKKDAGARRKTFIAPPCDALRRGRIVNLEKVFRACPETSGTSAEDRPDMQSS